jgi:hypothetical protein
LNHRGEKIPEKEKKMKKNNATYKAENKNYKRVNTDAQDIQTPREIHDIEADLKKMFEDIFK